MYNFHADEECSPCQRETTKLSSYCIYWLERRLWSFCCGSWPESLYHNELSLKLSYPRRHSFYRIKKRWRNGLAVKSTNCSCRGPGSDSQHPHGSSQQSIIAVPKDLMTSFGICMHQTHMWYTYISASKISIHLNKS